MTTPDPTGDTSRRTSGYMTLALTVGARFVEVAAHRRAAEQRSAEQQAAELAQAVKAQTRAEAAVVKYDLRDVGRKEWWDTATVEQVAGGYAAARSYSTVDPELAGIARHMAGEIDTRYGVDADKLVSANEESARAFLSYGIAPPKVQLSTGPEGDVILDTQAYVDSLQERGLEQRVAQQLGVDPPALDLAEARQRAADRERAAAAELLTDAAVIDRLVHADGVVTAKEAGQDLPRADVADADGDRRRALADRLDTSSMNVTAKEARTVADIAQGRPAVEATAATKAASKAPKARTGGERGAERARGR